MGKIEVPESDGRRYAKSAEDEIPQPEPSTPLDELIRAVSEGDGAIVFEYLHEIRDRLVELRRYRGAIRCEVCGRSVLGRKPVCETCYDEGITP